MSELLLEIFCEEIPARMQPRAEADLERLLSDKLKAAGLDWSSLTTFAGPRRLGLVIDGLPEKTADVRDERKGPRVGAPEQAVAGFLRGAGLESLDQCETREDKKGAFYVAIIEKPGRSTADVVAEALPELMKAFPWPKSMKIGEGEKAQRWVRPLQRVLCLFDGSVVPFEVFGIASGNETEGHRVHGRGPFVIENFAHYTRVLADEGKVIQQRADREAVILEGARKVCLDAGLELVEDQGLLTEVAGLVEHPVPLLGEMDPDFLDLPPEVITLTMKTHQKYFAVRDPKTGQLAPRFVVVANQTAPDGGVAIAAGNARVLSARLSDARHFWDNDRKKPLTDMAAELSKITFHEKLGTVADKVDRVAALARELAPVVDADADFAEKAARLAKADLVSEMVYEFPELQGAMGRYYAQQQGEPGAVADAIKEHYKPQGPTDQVPLMPVSNAAALADKLDTLVSFWAINEKPTGSKDPFALRRAALGVIRILLEGDNRLALKSFLSESGHALAASFDSDANVFLYRGEDDRIVQASRDYVQSVDGWTRVELAHSDAADDFYRGAQTEVPAEDRVAGPLGNPDVFVPDLLAFFADRLKVHLRDDGIRHDVIDAVFALGDDDLVRVTARSRALQAFLDTEDGAALLAGFNRAANILKAEEKKDGANYDGAPAETYLASPPEDAERALVAALSTARPSAQAALGDEDFTAAMAALATLRAPIDAFFDNVTVNADDAALRRNRLLLLSDIREAMCAVADFNRIEG